jgi:hypothetical protein
MPPGLEEVLPLLLADGTDLGPPALPRVAVDAGQQAAGAPLLPPLRLEPPAHREPARPQGLQTEVDRGGRQGGRGGEVVLGDGTGDVEMAPNQGHDRLVSSGRVEPGGQPGRKWLIGYERRFRE